MLRAFIAVQLSDALKRQIGSVQAELKREVSGSGRGSKAAKIGWAQPEGIHLTLQLLGGVREGSHEEGAAAGRRRLCSGGGSGRRRWRIIRVLLNGADSKRRKRWRSGKKRNAPWNWRSPRSKNSSAKDPS